MTIPFRRVALCASCLFFTGPLLAQSAVNISGFLDLGVYRDASRTWKLGTIQRSNLAFSGSEDLGNGLSATFKLSTRFDMDTGANEGAPNKPFFHGESTVGLKGGFGAIKFGRALDALYANDGTYDPWDNFDRIASPAWDLWHYNFPSDPKANNGAAEYGRLNNGIFYQSPSLGGFKVNLSTSPEKRPGDLNRPYGVALSYGTGPHSVMLAHEKNSAADTVSFVGARVGLGPVALMGAYDVSKAKASGSKAKAATLGLQYTAGPWTFNAGGGQVDVDGTKAQRMASMGGIYGLSKRTSVYAEVAHKRFPGDDNVNVFGVGLSHGF